MTIFLFNLITYLNQLEQKIKDTKSNFKENKDII